MNTAWLIWWVVGYALGSVPFALVIGRLRGVDIRKVGSGNIGATNVGRALGRKWGVLCFILDVLKGMAPVAGAGWWMGVIGRIDDLPSADAWGWLLVGAAAVIGHVFPIWLRFKGGKGVATSLGVLLAFWPVLTLPGLATGLAWVVLVKVSRYVSVASIGAALLLPVSLLLIAWPLGWPVARIMPFLFVAIGMAALVVLRHHANLSRLMAGTENRIGATKESPDIKK